MANNNDELIRKHYEQQAHKHGESSESTMEDHIVRTKEVELILSFIAVVTKTRQNQPLRILDLGCGNGYAINALAQMYPQHHYVGVDFSQDLLAIARNRNVSNCRFILGDGRSLEFEDNYFDVVYTERCLINILEWEEQKTALREIQRILKPESYYLMIESFNDGLANNNKARLECGLPELHEAYHNRYFDKDVFLEFISSIFAIKTIQDVDPSTNGDIFLTNFLSSHYFIARVLHPLVTKTEWMRNTEFVKFFSFLPPVGNYSAIQSYILQKK